jgi:hypothetical protein
MRLFIFGKHFLFPKNIFRKMEKLHFGFSHEEEIGSL